MSELLKINVNDHTERKGNLTYLSWAWAWAEVLKIDPTARYTVHEFEGLPVCYLRNGSALVKVSVEIKGDIKTCLLPVMDNRNRSIVDPDSFAVNTAIMRCLTKCIALFGLGLYIFAGEDLPEGATPPEPEIDVEIAAHVAELTTSAELRKFFKSLPSDQSRALHLPIFKARQAELEAK